MWVVPGFLSSWKLYLEVTMFLKPYFATGKVYLTPSYADTCRAFRGFWRHRIGGGGGGEHDKNYSKCMGKMENLMFNDLRKIWVLKYLGSNNQTQTTMFDQIS